MISLKLVKVNRDNVSNSSAAGRVASESPALSDVYTVNTFTLLPDPELFKSHNDLHSVVSICPAELSDGATFSSRRDLHNELADPNGFDLIVRNRFGNLCYKLRLFHLVSLLPLLRRFVC